MNVAIAVTVKNEARFLRPSLLYHRHVGVDRMYVFLDRSTDNTRETVEDLDFVEIDESVSRERYANRPELQFMIEGYERIFTARQGLNVVYAIEKARNEGIDWIISLDADELLYIYPESQLKDHLRIFFNKIGRNIDAVRFGTLEALQRKLDSVNGFAEESLFVKPFSNFPRKMYDPYKDSYFKLKGALGHKVGKSAVRTSVDSHPADSHEFVSRDGSPLKTLNTGYVLHYYCYGFEDFQKKYTNFEDHPDQYLSGEDVVYHKRLWRDIVSDPGFSDDELREYYKKNIVPAPEAVDRLLKRKVLGLFPGKEKIIRIDAVRKAFEHL
ncbi:glycosyltransferase family 2 protein [Thermodesulfobacteriota bacterium]